MFQLIFDNNHLTITNVDTGEDQKISSTYILACDGANSYVRQKLNIKSYDYDCDQDWIVVDYEIDPTKILKEIKI